MKVASGHIHQVVGAVILQIVAAVVGLVLLILLRVQGVQLTTSAKGIGLAAIAGLCVGLAEIGSFYVLGRGIPVSLATPIIIGGSVVITVLIAGLVLQEKIAFVQVLGVLCIVGGIFLLNKKL